MIPLDEIHACAPVELKKHSFTFGIVTVNRTYYVEANSEEEVRNWCASIETAKEEVKGGTTVTSLEGGERTPMDHPSPEL